MQGEALRPGTKLCRLMGGAAVAGDPPAAVRSSPAGARDGVTKGLGTERTKKGAESTSDKEKSRGRSEQKRTADDEKKKRKAYPTEKSIGCSKVNGTVGEKENKERTCGTENRRWRRTEEMKR